MSRRDALAEVIEMAFAELPTMPLREKSDLVATIVLVHVDGELREWRIRERRLLGALSDALTELRLRGHDAEVEAIIRATEVAR